MSDTIAVYRICGMDVFVKKSDPGHWAAGGMGRSSNIDNTITLREGMPPDLELNTLLHEVIHMIWDMHGFEISGNEHAVNALANGLFAFMRDNGNPFAVLDDEDKRLRNGGK